MSALLPTLAVTAASILYWVAASSVLGVLEPWHAPYYPLALGGAILAAGLLGFALPHGTGRWGFIVILGQLVVLLVRSALGPLLAIGLLILALECVPAVAAAYTGASLRRSRR